ncbi:MAG: hypothetical protein ACUVRM_01880 [Bacillota bacterium]
MASGSLFTKTGPLLFTLFRRFLEAGAPRAKAVLITHQPVLGAVRRALQACGRDAPEVWAQLRRTISKSIHAPEHSRPKDG